MFIFIFLTRKGKIIVHCVLVSPHAVKDHWFNWLIVAYSAADQCQNLYWLIFTWSEFQWNSKLTATFLIHENVFSKWRPLYWDPIELKMTTETWRDLTPQGKSLHSFISHVFLFKWADVLQHRLVFNNFGDDGDSDDDDFVYRRVCLTPN